MSELLDGMGAFLTQLSDKTLGGENYKDKYHRALTQFEALFEFSGVGMILISPTMTVLKANSMASRITGYSTDIMENNRLWSDIFDSPQEVEHILKLREQRLAHADTSHSLQYECTIRHKDGNHRRLLVHVTALPDDENIISSFSDITELYDTHSLLSKSEHRFAETADLLPLIICEFNTNMEFTYINERGYETFGYTHTQLIKEKSITIKNLFNESDYPRIKEILAKRWIEHDLTPIEYTMYNAKGEPKEFLVVSSHITQEGVSTGLRTCLMDISDLKAVQIELQEREQRLQAIFDSSPIGIVTVDNKGVPLEMNNAFISLFNLPSSDTHRIPPLFTALDLTAEEIDTSRRALTSFRLIENSTTNTMDIIPTNTLFYSWHITPLESKGSATFLCQVIDSTQQKKRELHTIEEVRHLKTQLKDSSQKSTLLSRNNALQKQFETIPTIAKTSATLLITGESGTGKEVLAQEIHRMSDRAQEAFIAINCGALPENLLESELFGHSAGAFTGAKKDRKGTFLSAHKGTLFLDEIGEISPSMQVKLLRVLQERNFKPVGSDTSIEVDVRIITATHQNLAQMVEEGTFREDLYYRIKVLQFALPPLHQRKEDIPLLVEHFIVLFNTLYNKKIERIDSEALDTVLRHNFPGNIRELKNILEHAVIFCTEPAISLEYLPPELTQKQSVATALNFGGVSSLEQLEGLYLNHIIAQNGGNKAKAAKELGMHKATLFRKLQKQNR